jgi:hypothetical protein
MSVELSKEIWSELKRHINTTDRDDAAETFVSVLIDNDVSADEIRAVFKYDNDVKKALVHYLKDHDVDEDEDDENDDHYEDEEDEDY